ncbi:hypothetical protein JTB14_019841 [Gonioctena quinquepunctata]|nr:hypothetical protein JTB14_019841 [Gonioctena quinquepunctata]
MCIPITPIVVYPCHLPADTSKDHNQSDRIDRGVTLHCHIPQSNQNPNYLQTKRFHNTSRKLPNRTTYRLPICDRSIQIYQRKSRQLSHGQPMFLPEITVPHRPPSDNISEMIIKDIPLDRVHELQKQQHSLGPTTCFKQKIIQPPIGSSLST